MELTRGQVCDLNRALTILSEISPKYPKWELLRAVIESQYDNGSAEEQDGEQDEEDEDMPAKDNISVAYLRHTQGIRRLAKKAMCENGYKILQRDIALLEDEGRLEEGNVYAMIVDKRSMNAYRLWFSKTNYTDDHKSFWEVEDIGPARFDMLLN